MLSLTRGYANENCIYDKTKASTKFNERNTCIIKQYIPKEYHKNDKTGIYDIL